MYSKLYVFALALLYFIPMKAQRTKDETFYLRKYRPAIIKDLGNSNTKIFLALVNKHKTVKSGSYYGLTTGLNNTNYYNKNFAYKTMKTSLSYPDYVSEIHFNPDNKIIAIYKKTQGPESQQLNSFKYTTNLSAIQYITDLKTNKTYKRDIVFEKDETIGDTEFTNISTAKLESDIMNDHVKHSVKDNVIKYNEKYNAAISVPNVTPLNLDTYLRKGKAIIKEGYVGELYAEQSNRIKNNADEFIKEAFFKQPYNDPLSFFYIKKFKGFDIEPFNSAFADVKTFFDSNKKDSTLLSQAASVWKKEIKKLNTSDKKQKKLYLKGISNIVKVYYVKKNIDSIQKYVQKGREYSSKSNYLQRFMNINTNNIKTLPPGITLSEGVENFPSVASRFSNKSRNKINDITQQGTQKDIEWLLNMYLIKDLAHDSDSGYNRSQIFTALKTLYVENFLKKNYPNVAKAFKSYQKEVKNISLGDFFKKYPISSIDKNISYESINAYFDDNLKKYEPEHKSLIKSIIKLNSAIFIIRNDNRKTEQYNTALKDVEVKAKPYYDSLEDPKSEIVGEALDNFKVVGNAEKIINLNVTELELLSKNLLKFASYVYYPY